MILINNRNYIINYLLQIALFIFSFLYISIYYRKNNVIALSGVSIYVVVISWVITSWITQKYKIKYYQIKWKYIISPFIKSIFVNLFIIIILDIIIKIKEKDVYLALFLYSIIEVCVYSMVISVKIKNVDSSKNINIDINKIDQKPLNLEIGGYPSKKIEFISISGEIVIDEILKEVINPKNGDVIKEDEHVIILNSENNNDIKSLKYSICILNKEINEIININETIIEAYHKLKNGGYIITKYKEQKYVENNYINNTSNIIKKIRKIRYFVIYRIIPKISYLNKVYNNIFKRKEKVFSTVEVMGRLSYCGFDVIDIRKNGNITYILSKKTKTISINKNPSYFIIIKLNRIGLYGNVISIHKVRTMYPYSEYLQKKINEDTKINSMGKYENDYRITMLGKICRKYWLDEIPQLLDWLRGEIKLVGIRAMSKQYFNLYPNEYKDLYYKVKPGLISPIFDEKTNGFEQIMKIEKAYLEEYLRKPIVTDIKYIFITLKRMMAGARSK